MLDVLRRIVQEVNAARDLDEVLSIIVRQVKRSTAVDVASVYLTDTERRQHVLMTTEGLNPDSVGIVRLGLDEGLVGLVTQRAEPVNLAHAHEHPNFRFFPDSGEEVFPAFLGVPIIHQRKVLGVLVVQRRTAERFPEDQVSFLITLAAQLAAAIAHAEASGGRSVPHLKHSPRARYVAGVPGAPGVAIGTAVVTYAPANLDAIPDRQVDDVEAEEGRFRTAVKAVLEELRQMQRRLKRVLPAEDRALFDAYALLLESDSMLNGTVQEIRAGNWAEGALRKVVLTHARRFDEMEDDYLRERAQDIREIGRRVLLALQKGSVEKRQYPRRTVLVGDEIGATHLAEVPTSRIAGVISTRGSSSSHIAILARAMGIPAVMGATDLTVARVDGREVVADGYQGRVYIQPSAVVRREYARLLREQNRLSAELETLREQPAQTLDGLRVLLYVNTGLQADIGPSLRSGAEGIGLYRTEFPFMIREQFPGEDEQTAVYRHVLEAFAPRPVTLRTLDVGGDKALPYFPVTEDNPFLGWRGIRITLDHPEIFLTQARAMLRAASGLNNLQILLPMITDLSEVADAQRLLRQAYNELSEEGLAVEWPKVGAMIEVPSTVYQARELAPMVDFFSIGTNDLTQYLLAVDRNNARVAKLYDMVHPAVLRAIKQTLEAAREYRCPVSVCGEMAGDAGAVILLLGMGVNILSMTAAGLPRVKWAVRSFTRRRCRMLANKALNMNQGAEIRAMLNRELERNGLAALIWGRRGGEK